MSIAVLIKIIILSALFVISGGAVFSQWGRKHIMLLLAANMVAIASGVYLGIGIYEDLKTEAIEDVKRALDADKKQTNPSTIPVKKERPIITGTSANFTAGKKFQDCDTCPKMSVIPAGTFTMGSRSREKDRQEDEGPLRDVSIKKFAVGRFEVTVGEYFTCVDFGKCRFPQWMEKGSKYNIRTGSHDRYKKLLPSLAFTNSPIVGISWNDAKAYAKWLSERTGKPYRLLSEAEWEYVALAGSKMRYWWGDNITKSQANYGYTKKLVPVDSFKPNAYGLYNVHGNVLEWVEDCWHKTYDNAPNGRSPWLESNDGDCTHRVLRGGSWDLDPHYLRARYRYSYSQTYRIDIIGFRVARTLKE